MNKFNSFSGYEGIEEIRQTTEKLKKIEERINELEAVIGVKRKSFHRAKPDSTGEQVSDVEEITFMEKELNELRQRKTNLMGGSLGAD